MGLINDCARKVLKDFSFTAAKRPQDRGSARAHPASGAAELRNIKLSSGQVEYSVSKGQRRGSFDTVNSTTMSVTRTQDDCDAGR